ncbi:MAG TPA: discoidin domain-containing protein, partial [Alphaproteobacteria bacterium]|nr:discoidin domain-containing protein [Alphaproteobacteria bacterium]
PDYSIQLSSDDTNWTTVYTTTNGPGSINDLAAIGAGRYVRMYGTQRATQYGYSLWEFEVFPALTPQLTIAPGGTNVIVSWPDTVNSLSLQSTPVLGAPNWNNVAIPPYLLNSEYLVTNSISGPARFYRLYQNP